VKYNLMTSQEQMRALLRFQDMDRAESDAKMKQLEFQQQMDEIYRDPSYNAPPSGRR
jgi:hypothetical protein